MKIKSLEELDTVLSEWVLRDNLPEDQTIEVPLYLIKDFRIKCYEEQYLATLKQIKAEIEHRIKINEGKNNEIK